MSIGSYEGMLVALGQQQGLERKLSTQGCRACKEGVGKTRKSKRHCATHREIGPCLAVYMTICTQGVLYTGKHCFERKSDL